MTISDIAKMAGVSSAAVSRYLNGGPLSEQKRAIIREVVEKTGYRPDTTAQTLRTGKVNQIGVIAPSIGSQSVGQLTAGIASELDARNYLLLLGNTELDAQRELGYLTAMQRNHVAGIILLGSYYTPQLAQALKNCSVPVVVTGQRFPDVACVYNDDHTAARELTQRMLEHGRRRIVYIGGSERDDATGIQRREGVQDALRDAGLDGDQLPLFFAAAPGPAFRRAAEVSVLSFTDGKVVKPMVSSMDHKRANDHDTGLNTGGMGTIAPNPYYTPEVAAECMEKIFLPTIKAMNAEGCPFKGCLYFGLMLTPDGPKVIEYNCRFGDPETQVVLPLLEGDLLHIMQACTNGTLENEEVKFSDGAAACVILASGGYPVAYEKGKPITGLVDGQLPGEENVTVYHSGTAITEDGTLVTAGGRVLGVTATGPRLTNALSHAYEAAEKISFEKLHKRSDIGLRALKALAEKE